MQDNNKVVHWGEGVWTSTEFKCLETLLIKIKKLHERDEKRSKTLGHDYARLKEMLRKKYGPRHGKKFDEVLSKYFGITGRRANQLIQDRKVTKILTDAQCSTLPANPRISTELGSLEEQYPDKIVPAWKAIVIKSEETGRKIDHKLAREIVVEYLPPTTKKGQSSPQEIAADESKEVCKKLNDVKTAMGSILPIGPNNQSTVAIVELLESIEKMTKAMLPRWKAKLPAKLELAQAIYEVSNAPSSVPV